MNKTEIVAYYCDIFRERTTYAFYHMINYFSQNSHKCGTFIRNDEATVTYHYHPEATVHVRVHSW